MLGCKHKWEVLSETTTKSKFESAIEAVRGAGSNIGNVKIPHQMCDAERKHIVILACKECGNTKRFVEKI